MLDGHSRRNKEDKAMKVFVTHSLENPGWGERLKSSLEERGISVWSDAGDDRPDLTWTDKLEQAMRDVEAVVVLIDPRSKPDEKERRVWQVALGAVWSDPNKRMIPFLLRNAEAPGFARSTVPRDGSLPVIRAKDPKRDWERAVNDLVALLRNEADMSRIEQIPAVTERDREEHRKAEADIRAYIESIRPNFPEDPAEWRAWQARR
jgi:hypothetical protein